MRYIFLVIAVLSFGIVSAQQINPIPDYVFKNQMSVGRSAVTDTAAYMSIGPRYGATKGFMPPIVSDTASLPANKRNGLFIFSVQKNKYLYWDSVGVKWAEMAGTGGAAVTGTGTTNKLAKFTTTTNIGDSRITDNGLLASIPRLKADSMFMLPKINTTPTDSGALRYAVADSSLYVWTGYQWKKSSITNNTIFGGTTTTNYIPKFTATSTVSNSIIYDNGTELLINTSSDAGAVFAASSGEVLIGGTNDIGAYLLQVNGSGYFDNSLYVNNHIGLGESPKAWALGKAIQGETNGTLWLAAGSGTTMFANVYYDGNYKYFVTGAASAIYAQKTGITFSTYASGSANNNISGSKEMVYADGELIIGALNDQGAYLLQINGAIYNNSTITTGAPTSGTAKPWRLGEAATVSPTSPNRTIRVEIDGTVYYIHAKTTND